LRLDPRSQSKEKNEKTNDSVPDDSLAVRSDQCGSDYCPVTDIRKVDFLNFTYNPTQCSQEYGRQGIGRIVNVRDGEFKNKSVYFSVMSDKIIYADLTGDGKEEAIVPIDCGAMGANFSRSEVNVYTLENGHATLLAATNDKSMERDYRANYADADGYWELTRTVSKQTTATSKSK
jgi:hypothetical protein